MKTNNKILTSLFVMCMFLGFITTACTDEVEYTPADKLTTAQVYFPNDLSATINLTPEMTSFQIELRRIIKTEALTVNLTIENENPSIFNVPATATFAAGEDVTNITVVYDPTQLDFDDFTSIRIAVSDENLTSPYGNFVYAFSVGIPAPWITLGKATLLITDWVWVEDDEVELQQNEIDPTRYRLVEPFANREMYYSNVPLNDNAAPYLEFRILPAGSTHTTFNREDGTVTVTTTVDGLVFFEPAAIGVSYEDGGPEMAIWHPVARSHPDFDTRDESNWLHNIVTQWSDGGAPEIVQLAPFFVQLPTGAGWNYTQDDGVITILFPGVELVSYDYSVGIEYTGRLTNPSGDDYATAQVTLGEDVDYAQVALVPGGFNFDDLFDIIDGVIESVEIKASGAVSLPCAETGTYTFIVISYDAKGEAQEYDSVTFDFYSSAGGGAGIASIEDFYGDYVLTAKCFYSDYGLPDANMSVSISAGDAPNTLSIEGFSVSWIGYTTESLAATFDPATGLMSIAPQQLDNFYDDEDDEWYEMYLYTTTDGDDYSETTPMTFNRMLSGQLALTPTSKAIGYYIGDEDGDWDGQYNLVFTPQSDLKSTSAMKPAASLHKGKIKKTKELGKATAARKAKSSEENVVIKQKGSVKSALKAQRKAVLF